MKRNSHTILRRVVATLTLVLVCGASPLSLSPAFAAVASDAQKREFYTDRPLTDQNGRELRFYSDVLKDRVVLVNFFFTNCRTTAALQSKVISDLQRLLGTHLGKDIFLVSLTVDPARDTPAKVKAYARAFAARPGWSFLTGRKEHVDFINTRLGSYTDNPDDHPAFILLANVKTGHWIKVDPDTGPGSWRTSC